MVSINTNLTSLITQRSLNQSTNKLNQAIERMSTGYKINHAGDNAANYSISTNMSTQLSACDIAADNISMGMDLLQTAQDTIAGMQDRGSRIHALITQARNGTYGADSLNAMTQEAQALVSEIQRLYTTTEYNGISLYDRVSYIVADWLPKAGESGFIDETDPAIAAGEGAGLSGACGLTSDLSSVHNGFIAEVDMDTPDVIVTDPAQLASAISSNTKIGIGNAETLAKLAELVNAGTTCSGKTIILTENVDLTDICAANTDGSGNGGWTPIGTSSTNKFQGTFNGNGHKVTGLYIKREGMDYQGLFGYAEGALKNIGVEGVNVTGQKEVGGLVGYTSSATATVSNCYATGNVRSTNRDAGGLVGWAKGEIENCYAKGRVSCDNNYAGGLVGYAEKAITNSYATGSVTGQGNNTGGLAGYAGNTITNSYATGSVTGNGNCTGGLAGSALKAITNSYATGSVTGQNSTGGLAGNANQAITNSYATGSVTGQNYTGGLAGNANQAITNSYATGSVTGQNSTGGLVGTASQLITNSYATGSVTGQGNNTGGLAGYAGNTITNSYATGSVTGNGNYTGGLAGQASQTITNSYATGSVTGNGNYTGGLAGSALKAITNSYATGSVTGQQEVGGLAGYASKAITNSYATGSVTGAEYTGGFVGYYDGTSIDTCYSGGKVSGTDSVGGFIGGFLNNMSDETINISNSVSYSKVSGNSKTGSFIGEYIREFNVYGKTGEYEQFITTLTLNNCTSAVLSDYSMIGGCYNKYREEDESERLEENTTYDMAPLLSQISEYNLLPSEIDIQCGINGDSSCRINFDTNFSLKLNITDLTSDFAYNSITNFLNQLSQKSTELGAAQNRLESALESNLVQMNNLTSSLSTIRDADIGQVSSDYIRQQILQQACATLMSTANQSPSIALQLL